MSFAPLKSARLAKAFSKLAPDRSALAKEARTSSARVKFEPVRLADCMPVPDRKAP